MDDFTLAPEPLAPQFDFTNAQTPPFVQAPNQAKTPQGGMDKKQAMKLAIMLPLALKAGPGAVQGLLQGFNQHAETQYTRGRQQAADTRTQEQRDWQRNYQQGQLDNQRQTQQRQFLNDFATRVGSLDDPAAIDALTRLYAAQAGAMGIDASALQTYAQQYSNPTKLQQRAAEKAIAKLKSQYGEKWMEMGAQFTHRIGGSDQPVPFEQLLSMAGLQRDPNAPAIAAASEKPETRSIDVQAAEAYLRGDMETYNRLKQVKKEMGLVDNAPPKGPDPILEEMRRIRLEQMKSAGESLPPATQRRVDAKARGFDSLPVVKTTQKMAEAVGFANSLDPNTKNPADDQALIYAFAKAMDPDSVVREGEYATVQKYAQSWAQSFGFNAARVFSNTAFLTPQARANMKRTIQSKYQAGKAQYDNVRRSYASQINKITNGADGESWLTDYAAGFPGDQPDPTQTQQPVTVQPPARAGGAGPATAPSGNPFRRAQ
jgi:hypothetical protein